MRDRGTYTLYTLVAKVAIENRKVIKDVIEVLLREGKYSELNMQNF